MKKAFYLFGIIFFIVKAVDCSISTFIGLKGIYKRKINKVKEVKSGKPRQPIGFAAEVING